MIGSKVAHFEITALLGSGGMGEVYQATDTKLDRRVARIEIGKPVPLFTTRPQSFYDVAPDGQRFLLNTPLADTPTPPITVIFNWSRQRQ